MPDARQPTMLVASGLAKTLPGSPPRVLLAGVDLVVAPGELLAIVGESGCGKSTLLNLLAGLDTPDAGTIVLDGRVLSGRTDEQWAAERRRNFGFIFQAFHILPHLTVAQNVSLSLWLNAPECRKNDAAARVDAMLARVGLAGRGNAWPRELSGGELQRVAVARALIHRPAVILADEPTGNLDAAGATAVLDLISEAARDCGARCVLVTHSGEASSRADRRLRLNAHGALAAA